MFLVACKSGSETAYERNKGRPIESIAEWQYIQLVKFTNTTP